MLRSQIEKTFSLKPLHKELIMASLRKRRGNGMEESDGQ